MNRFLETITFMGNDALVPIDRIKYINMCADGDGYKIKIHSDDGEWAECFYKSESEKANKRYKMIKEILGAK